MNHSLSLRPQLHQYYLLLPETFNIWDSRGLLFRENSSKVLTEEKHMGGRGHRDSTPWTFWGDRSDRKDSGGILTKRKNTFCLP